MWFTMPKSESIFEIKQVEKRVVFRNQFIGLKNDLIQFPDGKTGEFTVRG